MKRSELIDAISERFHHLSKADVDASVTAILEGMTQSLARHGRIEVRGFAVFSVRVRPPRMGRNPRTRERIFIPATPTLYFKASKELSLRLNCRVRSSIETSNGKNDAILISAD